MLGKRGQFFLIAALVISGILIGFASLYNVAHTPKEDNSVYDLSSELNYENSQVIDQGVFTNLTQDQINANIVNLTNYYAAQNPSANLIIVFGNSTSITIRQYQPRQSGQIGVSTGGVPFTVTQSTQVISTTHNPPWGSSADISGQTINVTTNNQQLASVRINHGQNFYSVIMSVAANQTYVASGGFADNSNSTSG